MTELNVVSLSASPHEPSKTTALLDTIVAELAERVELRDRRILMSEIGPGLGVSPSRDGGEAGVALALQEVEGCDLLVVSTPIYRASYTGLFKHFFDFVGQNALVGKPVFLSAIGGNASHSLSIEHQLRPLFGFFRAIALPEGVFASNADFEGYIAGEDLAGRIESAIDAGMPIIRASSALKEV